jgi:signal transduction histidine kinase
MKMISPSITIDYIINNEIADIIICPETFDRSPKNNDEIKEMKRYIAIVKEQAITRERSRFARDVHDTLGQTMTILITLLQMSKNSCLIDPVKTETRLNEALRIANEGLSEVRRSLIGLMPENLGGLKNALLSLVSDFQTAGMEIEFFMDEFGNHLNSIYHDVVYRICQESLTNSLRHGNATQVNMMITFDEHLLKLVIVDDGCGCVNLAKGLGLHGMEQRIKMLNGNIKFNYSEKGFGIQVEIPVIA